MRLGQSKKVFIHFLMVVCLVCLAPARAAAWGNSAHRIIARVAAAHLNGGARAAVVRFGLTGKGGGSDPASIASGLAEAATYADEVSSLQPETSNWHFVDMPRGAKSYVPSRDCVETTRGDCAVAAFYRLRKIVEGSMISPSLFVSQRDSLKFLIHIVGDLHQPLHCGYRDDMGGNSVRVTFFGELTNLHSVWDTQMIERAKGGKGNSGAFTRAASESADEEYAARLHRNLDAEQISSMMTVTPEHWAMESYSLAVGSAYVLTPLPALRKPKKSKRADWTAFNDSALVSLEFAAASQGAYQSKPVTLGKEYYERNLPRMNEQLLKAGLRLARVLNEIYLFER